MVSEERVIKSEKIYDGRILSLHCDTVELAGQKYAKREIVDHPGGVAILATTPEDTILFVRQFRLATGKFLLELPAGLIEHNENPKEAALRELEEETGRLAGSLDFLMEFYSSPGFTNEKIALFEARDLSEGRMQLDETENLECVEYSLDEALKMVKIGQISDSKTIIALQYAEIERRKK